MVVKRTQKAAQEARTSGSNAGDIGARLRVLRKQRGLSLAHVAKAASLSPSFLSLVETGQRGVSISRLMGLMQFYGVRLGDLIAEPAAAVDPNEIVTPGWGARHYDSEDEGIRMFLLARDTNRTMMPGLFVFDRDGQSLELTSHPGEEFVYVLEGAIELTVEPAEPRILEAEDSAYFSAEQPHKYRNVGDSPARMIAVVSPPSI